MRRYKQYVAGILLGFVLGNAIYKPFSYYTIGILIAVLIFIYKDINKHDNNI